MTAPLKTRRRTIETIDDFNIQKVNTKNRTSRVAGGHEEEEEEQETHHYTRLDTVSRRHPGSLPRDQEDEKSPSPSPSPSSSPTRALHIGRGGADSGSDNGSDSENEEDADVYPGCIFTVDISLLNLKPNNTVVMKKLGSNLLLAGRAAKILSLTKSTGSSLFNWGRRSRLARASVNVKNVVSLGKDLRSEKKKRRNRKRAENGGVCDIDESDEEEEDLHVRAAQTNADDGEDEEEYEPTFRERLWEILEDPEQQSIYSKIVTVTITVMIFISVIVALLESLLMYADATPRRFFIIETICVVCFTVEFLLRIYSCPRPLAFMRNWMNVLDVIAIVPYYIDVIFDKTVPGLTVFRVVRMARIITLFKAARKQAVVYVQTMRGSLRTMYLLLLIDTIGALVFSTLIYYFERGNWDHELNVWMRPESYTCEVLHRVDQGRIASLIAAAPPPPSPFTTSATIIDTSTADPSVGGSLVNTTVAASTPISSAFALANTCLLRGWDGACCSVAPMQPTSLPPDVLMLLCTMRHNYPDLDCTVNLAQSPFDSIPKTMWYIFTTFSAVGYGDMFPKTVYGKIFGMITMFLSILALALPITVIGTNFHLSYDAIIGT